MEISLTFTRTQNRGGESVVFLHSIGTNGWIWKDQQQALSDYDCIIPDLPGFGRNNHIPWVSIQETARLIATLIERNANGGQAHLVGLSLGAAVVMEILANHSKVVRRAVVSGLNVLPVPNRFFMEIYGFLFSPFMKTKPFTRMKTRSLNIPEAEFEAYHQSAQQMSIKAFRAASRESAVYKLPENAAAIQTPILVVAGGNEDALILESINLISNTLPFACGYIVPFTGHAWNIEKPLVFSDMLKSWFKSYPVPDSLIPASTGQSLGEDEENQQWE